MTDRMTDTAAETVAHPLSTRFRARLAAEELRDAYGGHG